MIAVIERIDLGTHQYTAWGNFRPETVILKFSETGDGDGDFTSSVAWDVPTNTGDGRATFTFIPDTPVSARYVQFDFPTETNPEEVHMDEIWIFGYESIDVVVDIKPGSFPNSINLCSNGAVPIAFFGSDAFDVYEVDTETLRFAETTVKVVGKKDPHSLCSYEDVNNDLFYDLVCHFLTADIAGTDGQSSTATVNGELLNGTPFEGTDIVNIVKDTCN